MKNREGRDQMELWMGSICVLVGLTVVLLCARALLSGRILRFYNWDGRRYRFVGRGYVQRRKGALYVILPERVADQSWTTDYRIVPDRHFVRKHRYQDMLVRAGSTLAWVPVEEKMQAKIYYRCADHMKNREFLFPFWQSSVMMKL